MTVDLRTCVPGQLLKDELGRILEYKESINVDNSSLDGTRYKHLLRYQYLSYDETFTDNGIFDINSSRSSLNIWESCPWITDRKPTEEDGDQSGWVIMKITDDSRSSLSYWKNIKEGEPWIHRQDWKRQTPREKALALITKHKDSSTVGVWVPTPDEWDIIREGLAE